MIQIEDLHDGSVLLRFPYDSRMVAALKSQLPSAARRWNPQEKGWQIAVASLDTVSDLAFQYLGEPLPEFDLAPASAETVTELIALHYLGASKDRGNGERSAFGHDGREWRFIFPEEILQTWFGLVKNTPASSASLYALLGVKTKAPGADIKRAFKTAARQWHPDVCHEPDATEMFKRINHAYQVLADPAKRARYDAGLTLAASVGPSQDWKIFDDDVWKPPLRCGYVLVNAQALMGRLQVEEILQWTDIVDARGRVLVSSWPLGANIYEENWV